MFTLRFDMRAPDFGAPATQLYAAALDMSAWAEDHGCLAAVLCEHHCSPDGSLPAPLILASPRDTPTVCFVADDVDRAWSELGEYLLHDARMYAQWNPANEVSAGISHAKDVDELRRTSKSHRIITCDDAVRRGELLNLSPLCGGIPPAVAWPYLRRVGDVLAATGES